MPVLRSVLTWASHSELPRYGDAAETVGEPTQSIDAQQIQAEGIRSRMTMRLDRPARLEARPNSRRESDSRL
jgi:hypothetical protein